mmetsp:Transcript_34835/g.97732  ORF Transcript_34835/g.97732 Transcript_34835/m.97732 type:complete len:269 (-) Transcript_34835:22-828(-)
MGGEGGLKHVVRKRVHLERPQPKERQRLGYLEKHKDYVKRAQDYNKKQDTLKKLERKAYFKNDDEFTFRMVSHKLRRDGRAVKKGKQKTNDELKLVDSQDKQYIGFREQIDNKKVEKQGKNLHFLDADRRNKHTLFLDEDDLRAHGRASRSADGARPSGGGKRRQLDGFDVAAHFDTHPLLLGKKANRPRLQQLAVGTFAERAEVDAGTKASYRELLHRQERAKKLKRVREELELRENLRGKGKRKKASDATEDGKPAVYRWQYERKR